MSNSAIALHLSSAVVKSLLGRVFRKPLWNPIMMDDFCASDQSGELATPLELIQGPRLGLNYSTRAQHSIGLAAACCCIFNYRLCIPAFIK